jgi:hypothetical protein
MNILITRKKQNKNLGETLEDWDGEKGLTFSWILTQPVHGIHLNCLFRFICVVVSEELDILVMRN